jgi:hypothetical protein
MMKLLCRWFGWHRFGRKEVEDAGCASGILWRRVCKRCGERRTWFERCGPIHGA